MVEMKTIVPRIDEETGVAWLTFNRPEKRNALSRNLMAELIDRLKELRDNEKIKVIVTTGSNTAYSSGLDLYDLRDSWKGKRRWDDGGTTQEIITVNVSSELNILLVGVMLVLFITLAPQGIVGLWQKYWRRRKA